MRSIPLLTFFGVVKCFSNRACSCNCNENRFFGCGGLIRDKPYLPLACLELQKPGLCGGNLLFQTVHLGANFGLSSGNRFAILYCVFNRSFKICESQGLVAFLKSVIAFRYLADKC